jgi:S1-C subfamily serine protease
MLSLASALLAALPLQQGPDADLQAALAAERQRVELMDRVAPAVCSVMRESAPGGGSGVVFDPLGFVLTNFHVVGEPDVKRMKVGLPDGRLYGASVLGIDPGSDLAVLLLDARDGQREWPAVPLGDSDSLLVGEQVFAMGNPFLLATDFQPTVTFGIVSGTHRYQPGQGNRALVYPDCIQVDVPINPGNSGGPLFDMDGAVVGINGRISILDQRGRVNVGVGFAIASHQIRNFLPDLLAGRHAEHGTLDLNAWFMERPSGNGTGVFVQAIFEDSSVTAFGMQLGDELTRFNGVEIRSANQLATLVGIQPAGAWVELGFRPKTADGSFEAERIAEFPLRRLDTGSSRDEDRLATDERRRLALQALARALPAGEPAGGAVLEIEQPDGSILVIRRRGEMLRYEAPHRTTVRTGAGEGFRLHSDGTASDLTPEEQARLDRLWSCLPWLWRGTQLRERLADASLAGGAMVHGVSTFRAALPGDGERELWFTLDGRPAGCTWRDPEWRTRVELRVLDGRTRLVRDGEIVPGWHVRPPRFELPPEELFARPAE